MSLYNRTQGAFARLPECAVFLAGLSEMAPGDEMATGYTGVQARDARWWYGLRQHLGISETYPYLIQYPDGYDNTKRYPLIISLHGSLDNDVDYDAVQKESSGRGISESRQIEIPLHRHHAIFPGRRLVAGEGGCHADRGAGANSRSIRTVSTSPA